MAHSGLLGVGASGGKAVAEQRVKLVANQADVAGVDVGVAAQRHNIIIMQLLLRTRSCSYRTLVDVGCLFVDLY